MIVKEKNMLYKQSKTMLAAVLGAMILLSGCRVGPHYDPPPPPAATAPNYKESTVNFQDQEGWKVASPQDAMIRGKWWEVFNEPELNALEEELVVNNQSIKASFENFMQARAMVAQARSQYWPTVSVGASWSRSKSSGNLFNSSTANAGRTSTLWSLPVSVSWTPDLWGRIRNLVRTQEYSAQASAADLELEKLTEQTALAQYFFEIRGQDMLQQLLNQSIEAYQKALDAAQGAYDVGTGDYIAVVEARVTLKTAQSSAINVGLSRAQFEHAIATLIGRSATDFSIPVKPMLYTPPAIPTGVPSQLAERRPDIAAAERSMAQANATIGIGYGAFFPQISIGAGGGFESSSFKHLFDIASRFWSVGPSVSQVVFNGGLYRAQLHQYEAIYNGDLANYRQTVLNAFQQVEDALAGARTYSQQIKTQQEAVKSAEEFLDLENQRYQLGVDPYVNVVIAQTALLNNQVTLNTLHVQQILSTVQLVEALGGGWDRSQLITPAQTAAKVPDSDYKMNH